MIVHSVCLLSWHIDGCYICVYVQGACGYKGSVPVAVKTLSHEKLKEIDKFMQEVNLMKKFSHPNIVSLIGELACSLRFPRVRMVCMCP